jgi:hypothetical protein
MDHGPVRRLPRVAMSSLTMVIVRLLRWLLWIIELVTHGFGGRTMQVQFGRESAPVAGGI